MPLDKIEARSTGCGRKVTQAVNLFWRAVDYPFKLAAYVLIQIYRYSLSMFMGRNCRHAPTCSEFTRDAIWRFGFWPGGWIGTGPIYRCRPGGYPWLRSRAGRAAGGRPLVTRPGHMAAGNRHGPASREGVNGEFVPAPQKMPVAAFVAWQRMAILPAMSGLQFRIESAARLPISDVGRGGQCRSLASASANSAGTMPGAGAQPGTGFSTLSSATATGRPRRRRGLGKIDYIEPDQIAAEADIVLFAPRFEHLDQARDLVGGLAGKIVIDPNNPFNPARDGPARLQAGETAAGIVVGLFPRARVVKALHNVGVQTILGHREGQLAGFVASDDASAADIVAGLVSSAMLTPIVTGGIRTAALSEFPGPPFRHAFSPNAARRELSRLLAVSA